MKRKRALRYHSSTILTFVGVIGVIVTSVMAVKTTPKVMKHLEEAKNEKGEELTELETVQVAIPHYIPVAISCIATISCIFGANVLNKRNQASLVSAYALLEQSFQRYRKAANSVYGEDADSKIKIEAAKEIYVSADGYALYDSELDGSYEEFLFYDNFSERYFTSTMPAVLNAQYHLNRNFILRGDTCLNEFYEFLGIDTIECGYDIGWGSQEMIESGFMWIDFENRCVKLENGMECYIISVLYNPMPFGYEQ